MDSHQLHPSNSIQDNPKRITKPPVVRGARACTVCRTAKMKCVGAEDGQKQCQRCKRANVECIFEKHRRGRKPGSKLSEASKMLRRLEKGLNNAKLKSQSSDNARASPYSDSRGASQNPHYNGMLRPADHYSPTNTHFPSKELSPLNIPYQTNQEYAPSSSGSRSMEIKEDDEDCDRTDETLFPAKLIRKENRRNSFFQTILNPKHEAPCPTSCSSSRNESFQPQPLHIPVASATLPDPVSAGIIDEELAKVLFDLFFLRLNPFANLFDPALHSVPYVRAKCPFLFTTIIMAGAKFFRTELFKACQKMANDYAARAFAEAWKRVEVVQAFACLTYWKDPDDNSTWTYIGYACRMAVEIGLNRYVSHPPPHETEFQRRERRNRERTYLVLFVHDRSLSMQTGRHWMLPEDELIKRSSNWHKEGGHSVRPEDVVVAAFVQLRRIAAETSDRFDSSTEALNSAHHDVNYDAVLHSCNNKLSQWMETWQREMHRAGGESFHFSFLNFFRLHVRLFLNSYGIQSSMSPTSRASPSMHALSACYSSALETLRIASKEFASMSMLRYGQDSITVMTAYSAVFLLKLLRSSNILAQLHDGISQEIHSLISQTAEAYQDAPAAYHARFLLSLLTNDVFKAPRHDTSRYEAMPIDPRLQGSVQSSGGHSSHSPPNIYRQQAAPSQNQSFQFPASPHLPAHPVPHGSPNEYSSNGGGTGALGYSTSYSSINGAGGNSGGGVGSTFPVPQHASELDAHYWRNMFLELGFGADVDSAPTNVSVNGVPATTAMATTGGENVRSIGSSSSYHGGQSHTCQQQLQMHSNNGHSHHHHQSASQPPVTQSQSSYYHHPHQHQHQHHHHLHSSSAQPSTGYSQ